MHSSQFVAVPNIGIQHRKPFDLLQIHTVKLIFSIFDRYLITVQHNLQAVMRTKLCYN